MSDLGIIKIKLPQELEAVLRDPKTRVMLIEALESRGVVGDPPLHTLSPDDQDTAVRFIMAELRKREAKGST